MSNTSPIGFSIERNVASASISLTSPVIGATIRYTTDGSEPSAENGNIYTGSFELVGTKTVKAIVMKEGLTDSAIARLEITVIVPDIVLEKEDGTAVDNCKVIIVNMDAYETFTGIVFRYTTNGSEPTETSPVMDAEIEVTTNCIVKVKGFSEDFGNVDTASITINDLKVQTPLVDGEQGSIMPDYFVEMTYFPDPDFDFLLGNVQFVHDRYFATFYDSNNISGYSYGVQYSFDCITWHNIPDLGKNSPMNTVTYHNGKFFVCSNGLVQYSENGIDWNDVRLSNINNSAMVLYGNDEFFIFYNANNNYRSSDGVVWTKFSVSLSGYTFIGSSAIFDGSRFVGTCAITKDGNIIRKPIYSYNGVNWNIVGSDNDDVNILFYIIYGNGLYISYTTDRNYIYVSEDFINWTQVYVLEENYEINDFDYGNGKFVFERYDYTNKLYYSVDGINWGESPLISGVNINKIWGYDGERFLFNSSNAGSKKLLLSNKC